MLKCYEILFVIKRKRTPYTVFVDFFDAISGNMKVPNVQYDRFHYIKDCKPNEELTDGDINYCVAYWNDRKENRLWEISRNTIRSKEIKFGEFNKTFMPLTLMQVENYARMYYMYRTIIDNY